ncbi:MAG: VOC family protein [Pseudorhodoplanes sp.]|nr:VOC family protein [Pseudorhodoplanes sp.]
MARGLDHLVHAVRDLDAGAALYRRLGFTVGARNRHPWGTHNHVLQTPGFFVEILTLAEPDKLGEDGISRFFGRFNGAFIERHDGLAMMILESRDAAADRDAFAAVDIAASDVLRFEREGRRPDGSAVKVAFSLAFARCTPAADAGFAVCQQHFPENFWNPAFQQHTNGVTAIAAAVLVADNPSDYHIFLSAFSGVRSLQSTSSGVSAATPRGDIQIMDPQAYESHFGHRPPSLDRGLRIAAMRFRTRDLGACREALTAGDVAFAEHMGRLVVSAGEALGATIVFEPA